MDGKRRRIVYYLYRTLMSVNYNSHLTTIKIPEIQN
jgi:hypothetical protein